MANTITPNMNLIVPGVGSEAGPTYATDINSSLTIIDGHSHVAGSGVQITPAAINVNANFPINNYSLTNIGALTFLVQTTTPVVGSLYVAGVDLYYLPVNGGTPVQITAANLVNASSSGISSGTASAAFSAGVLVVNAASTTPANIQAASILIGNNIANSKFLTLAPPTAMAANFSITLPNVSPGGVQLLTIDTSGNIGQNVATAIGGPSADAVGTAMTSNGANAIANTRTRATGTSVAIGGVAISTSCGTFTTASGTPVAITNLSVTIVTSGKPVTLMVIPDGSGTATLAMSSNSIGTVQYLKGASVIGTFTLSSNSGGLQDSFMFPMLDTPAAGTYTYSLTASASGGQFNCSNFKLVAYEL